MMHQPVDYDDVRFYAGETLLIPNGAGRGAVLGAPADASTGLGALLVGVQADKKRCTFTRGGQPPPPRRRAHRALRRGGKQP